MKKILCTIMVAVLLWIALSTVEVMAKNMDDKPEYNNCNMWVLLMNECRE